MNKSVLILGRQPALGLAELESLYGAAKVRPAGTIAALLDVDPTDVNFARLGGAMKLAKLLTVLDTTNWDVVEKYLRKTIPSHLQNVPDGKFKLGLSVYGLPITVGKLNASALTLKKIIKSTGRSVRIIANKELELNSAQIAYNGLVSATGWELLVIRDGNSTILAQTVQVQDIDAYAARDQGRPKRDARVGMLPPKLAQTIVNLAVADTKPSSDTIILDPFCGTGVILQEALLMSYRVHGSDLEQRMIDFTDKNLDWLLNGHDEISNAEGSVKTEAGDATDHIWNPTPTTIAAETYLGQPFASLPTPEKLEQVRSSCNLILKKFLRNIAPQLKPGTRLCLAVPAWQRREGQFLHLSLIDSASGAGLDQLQELGYNRLSFEHVATEDLVYARADQIVARELLVIVKS